MIPLARAAFVGIALATLALPACSTMPGPAAGHGAPMPLAPQVTSAAPETPVADEADRVPALLLASWQIRDGESLEPARPGAADAGEVPLPNPGGPCLATECHGWRDRCGRLCTSSCDWAECLWPDCKNFYSCDTLTGVALGVAIAAPLANTHADQGFRNWYQSQARSSSTDSWSSGCKPFGDHWIAIPVCLGAFAGGALFDDTLTGAVVEDWGGRSLRALLVGAPTVGILQAGLGAGRPEGYDSHWRPFEHNNAVSGHGFVSSVPFLTAASMTEQPLLRYPLFAASFVTAWSRVNDDQHYLSQALLGWWIGYLSVRSVNRTEAERSAVHFLPYSENGPGFSIMLER